MELPALYGDAAFSGKGNRYREGGARNRRFGKVRRLDSAMLVLLDLWGWISPRMARISSVRPGKVRRLSAFDY